LESSPRGLASQAPLKSKPPSARLAYLPNFAADAGTSPRRSAEGGGKPADRHSPRGVFSHRDLAELRDCRFAGFKTGSLAERFSGGRSNPRRDPARCRGAAAPRSRVARAKLRSAVAPIVSLVDGVPGSRQTMSAACDSWENENATANSGRRSSQESLHFLRMFTRAGRHVPPVITAQTIELPTSESECHLNTAASVGCECASHQGAGRRMGCRDGLQRERAFVQIQRCPVRVTQERL